MRRRIDSTPLPGQPADQPATGGRAYGYARVSTLEQKLEPQIEALVAAGVKASRVFSEQMSGMRTDRPELATLLKVLDQGDTLVVWRLDRLGRSLKELIDLVTGLEQRGVQFRSLTEGIDTSTPTGKLTFHLFGAFAEFERNLIRERTMNGLRSARAAGRRGGRRTKMTTPQIKRAKNLIRSDPTLTMPEVAAALGVGLTTLYRAIPGGRQAIEEETAQTVNGVAEGA